MKPKPFVRLSGLIAWLENHGFTRSNVLDMVNAGTIPRKHIEHKKRESKRAASRSQKSTPKTIQGRAWYNTAHVAKALEIDL